MPGIVGLFTKLPRECAERRLQKMVSALKHEAFYQSGTWQDNSLGLYVGWVARQGSFADGNPFCTEDGNVLLFFSGEDFPTTGTQERLRAEGHRFHSEGGSYLPHLYEEDPARFPSRLNGRFHALLVDRVRKTATVMNDRYGMGRIYYHESKDGFYFGAEAKAILAVRPELRNPDPRGLGEYVSCGCVLENRTIFKDIHVLPPASAWRLRAAGEVEKNTYFDPREWEEQERLEPEAYYRELKETFIRNLPKYFQGKEPIGVSLTGGLDTRMIMAWHKPPADSLPCYSFGGMFRECQDVLLARKVANVCRQPHEVIPVGQEFLSQFPQYVSRTIYLTDGCVDSTHSPDLYVNECAAKIAPVRMTGNYGGEVLRRVRAFKPVEPAAEVFNTDFINHISLAKNTYSRILSTHPLSFAVFKQAPWHHYGLQALEQTQLSLRSPYLDNEIVSLVFRAPEEAVKSNEVSLRLIADGSPKLRMIRTDFGVAAEHSILPARLIRELHTFTFKSEYAYDYGMPQWVAQMDHYLSAFRLERLFLGRHKFYHFRIWYREALSEYVRQMLLDPKTLSRPYLQKDGVERIVCGHLKGNRNYTLEIHKLLTLELIHRHFFDLQ